MTDVVKKSNSMGTVGMVLAIIAAVFFLLWPVLPFLYIFGWILNILAFIFSMIGVFRAPRAKAIVGLVLSCVSWFLMPWIAAALFVSAIA